MTRAAERKPTIFVTIHSFTPVFKGIRRNLHLGILHDRDSRFADLMLRQLGRMQATSWSGGMNLMGRRMACATRSICMPARAGLLNVMIEIRNDLITTEKGQQEWAERLATTLQGAAAGEAVRAAS